MRHLVGNLWIKLNFFLLPIDGYGTQAATKAQKKSFWCEEDEEKLTRVFHQLKVPTYFSLGTHEPMLYLQLWPFLKRCQPLEHLIYFERGLRYFHTGNIGSVGQLAAKLPSFKL